MPVLVLALASALVACKTNSSSEVSSMYRELVQDRAREASDVDEERALDERQAERRDEVRRLIDEHGLKGAKDHWMAAVVLVESDDLADLERADELGRKAAELGEPVGLRVSAEAVDKRLVKQGMHQRYGTQFYFDEVMQEWRLYPVDPRTTDGERSAVGVGTLAELHRDEARLNGR